MVFLPAYSPELNPCELVFAQLKSHLRKIPNRRGPLMDLIMEIAPRISSENMLNYYMKCIRPDTVLPELRTE
jgi:transposase